MADKIQDHHIIFSHLVKKIHRANGKVCKMCIKEFQSVTKLFSYLSYWLLPLYNNVDTQYILVNDIFNTRLFMDML